MLYKMEHGKRSDLKPKDASTFSGAGKVGLWTKADSVTAFDSLTVQGR